MVLAEHMFVDVVVDADALVPLALLALSGKPPPNALDALTVRTPTISDFNRWRMYCALQTQKT